MFLHPDPPARVQGEAKSEIAAKNALHATFSDVPRGHICVSCKDKRAALKGADQ